jgi:shikimate O-hydroxycinnamoyltransferase
MKTIPLTPVDHIFTGAGSHPVTFALAYEDAIDPAFLRRSLDDVLEHFPLLRSKLTRISEHAYGFQLADDGLSFETMTSSEAFEDAEDFRRFVSPVNSVEGEPLTRIKLTQTPRGSVLGISISHALADGFSYFHFLSSWARISQGERILSPSHQRELLIPDVADQHEPVTSDDVLTRCGLFWGEKRRHDLPTEPIHEERLLVSNDDIKACVEEARQEHDVLFFDNDVLTAWLWKKYVTKWSEGQDNPTTYVTCPFDFRRALKEVPRTYFGCALCFATASIDYESLAHASLGDLALLVRKAVGRIRRDYVWDSLETLERLRRQRGLGVMEEIHVRPPQNGIAVTNVSRLPIQALDFGSGTPRGFQAYTQISGGAAILPAQDGVEVRVFHPAK